MSQSSEFSLNINTINGSGSQSANNILLKSLFKSGAPCSGKNIFPSNIAGLPTSFFIKLSGDNFLSYENKSDIVLCLNRQTINEDFLKVKDNGIFFYDDKLKFEQNVNSKSAFAIPFNDILKDLSDSIKIKKLLKNMIYVGLIAELLDIKKEFLTSALEQQLKGKEQLFEINNKAIEAGKNYFKENLSHLKGLFKLPKQNLENKILIDGNTSTALGMTMGGCSFLSWYPITPSSSVAESFINYCGKYRKDKKQKNNFAVVQAEDELSAISMVVGAGWAGARAATATSGPGMSLMAEASGLMYFAEIPGVLINVQRAGPSTGLPTRTLQGDLLSAVYLSHGDTKHIILLPTTPEDCFNLAQSAFDLAEQYQTLVIYLSDLDLGMNSHICNKFEYPTQSFNRGKVLNKEQLQELNEFNRYEDKDGDHIPYRTLPGTEHDLAAYFTRGTGHDKSAKYTESSEEFEKLLIRLKDKIDSCSKDVPKQFEHISTSRKKNKHFAVVGFGSTYNDLVEVHNKLLKNNYNNNLLQIRSFPFHKSLESQLNSVDYIFVVELNRDGQMHQLLLTTYPHLAEKIISITQFNGLPLNANKTVEKIMKHSSIKTISSEVTL